MSERPYQKLTQTTPVEKACIQEKNAYLHLSTKTKKNGDMCVNIDYKKIISIQCDIKTTA